MDTPNDKERAFSEGNRALIAAQFSLFAYICALVGDTQDAQDVLQETNLKICRELGVYDPARPFLPWAKKIAYYEVLSYRTRKSRNRLVLAEDDFFDRVASDAETLFDGADRDMAHLNGCLGLLTGAVRELVESRYIQKVTVNELARRRRCSPNAVSLLLFKARRSLAQCIQEARNREVVL